MPLTENDTPEVSSEVTDNSGHFNTLNLLKATLGGKDPEQVAYGNGQSDPEPTQTLNETEDTLADFDSQEDSLENRIEAVDDGSEDIGDDEQLSVDSELSDSVEDNVDSSSDGQDIEVVTLKMKDPKTGRAQKIKIDYNDRKAIKENAKKAAGMRKAFADRDVISKQLQDSEKKYDELSSVYTPLAEAFETNGIRGVVELLSDSPDAWKEAVDAEIEERERIRKLSPEERFQMERELESQRWEQQLAAERAKREAFEQQIAEREQQAQIKDLKARVNPSFDRYRFSGTLGDPVLEQKLDSAVWSEVMTNLSDIPDNVELTQALIDKEFRKATATFRKALKVQSEKNVKKTIERKKAQAGERAQVTAKKGLNKSNAASKKFAEDLQTGNIRDAFNAMISGKVKLK